MMNEMGPRRMLPDQSSGSGHTLATLRHPYITDPIYSKRVCFYKSGDPQFNGLRMVINNRTFKTFDALLDSLSKKVPLPFGVRNITTPRGVHAVHTLGELEDGKSYICSDRRKVKPINLVLASKKLPPWYHARPTSARRQAVQLARRYPGRATHKQKPAVVVRTPKRIMVFRNGDPSIRHTVMLQKKTTPTFESLLDYVSELMQFHVVKLHTPDGRRLDGLPALILCSECVVAAGKEPFKSANYNAQKSPAPTWLPTNQMGPRRLKRMNRKKKSLSGTSKSSHFSPSSERYLVNQIHNSIAGGSNDLPSNPTGSVELETGHRLESVAETEVDTCLEDGARGQDGCLPTDDDIEKSFRVNQDGSMTVEMRVRLTIKEEETINWTTTLTRSSMANQLNAAYLPDPEPVLEQENSFPESREQDYTVSIDTVNRKHSKDDEDPPSVDNGILSEDGAVIEESCMVQQSSTRPVPKPRRVSYVDINNRNNINQSTFKSAGLAEILQIEDSREESTEAVLHIYEQQTCQDSFLANGHYCTQGVSMYGFLYGRPATSDTARFSSNDFETELGRPSTASESINIWRTDNMSLKSDLTIPSLRTGVNSPLASKNRATNVQKQPFPKPAKKKDSLGLLSESSKENSQPRAVNKLKRMSSRPKVIRRYVRWTMSPGKRLKESKAGSPKSHRKGTTFSSAAFLRRIYGYKPKSVKSTSKQKQKPPKTGGEVVNTESSELPSDTIQCVIKDPNILSPLRENKSTRVSFKKNMLDVSPTEVSQPRGILRRQKSVHQERKCERDSYNVNENMSLPALNSSSSVINEYVEHWLEKSHSNPTAFPDGDAQKVEAATPVGTEEGMSEVSDINCDVIVAAGEPGCLEAETFEKIPLPDSFLEHKETQSNESFVNKPISPSPSMEKTASITQTTMEMFSDNQAENKQAPIKISVEKITPSHSLSIEQAPLPVKKTELTNTEHCVLDVSSVASSPLYRFSSASSLASEDRLASLSPTFDQAPSPADRTSEKTNISSTIEETSLSRNPSVKRARLVSNLSFERKMSLRKTSLEKSALTSDTALDNTISSTPIKIAVGNISLSSNRTQLPTENSLKNTPNGFLDLASQASSPSYCMSASPTSLTSEERAFSASPSSDEAPSQTNISSSKVSKTTITPSLFNQKEAASPKPPMKKTKLISNLSLEKKLSIRKASSEKSEILNDPPLEKTQVSSSPSVGRKPLPRNQSFKPASSRNPSPDKNPSPNLATRKIAALNSSPTTERLPLPHNAELKKRFSPYSQSLEVVSPPVKLKSKKKLLSKNLSLDNTSEPAPSKRKGRQETLSKSKAILPDSSLDKTLPRATPIPLNDGKNEETKGNKADHNDNAIAAEKKSLIEAQITPQPLKLAPQPDIKPVLEKLCYSIKSIRQITQNKRPSCLEKSNSLPDFSSHVASTFGSSTKALLAFLSVMTLKGGITSLNMHDLSANNVSCAEALRMIYSLREIASIEDADKLKASLSDLQQSTSAQLLKSWKGFQELSDKYKSRSPSPNPSEHELVFEACPTEDCGIEENAIDELINELDMPENLKEELAALPVSKITDSDDEGEMASRITEQAELSPEEKVNVILPLPLKEAVGINELTHDKDKVDVKSMIEKFMKINQPKKPNESSLPLTVEKPRCKRQNLSDDQKEVHNEQSTREKNWEYEQDDLEERNKAKCLKNPIDHNVKQISEEQLRNAISLGPNDDKEIDEGTQSSRGVEDEESEGEEEEQECHIEHKPSQEKPDHEYMDVKVCIEESMSSPDVEEQSSSEEEQSKVECKELQQMSKEDSLSNLKSHSNSEEEEDKQPSPDNCMELNISSEESKSSPDVQEQSSSEQEQREAKSKELQAISEESLSNPEEGQDGLEEEQEDYTEGHEEKMKEELQGGSEEREDSPEVDKISLEYNEHHADNLAFTEAHICGNQTSHEKFQHTVTDGQRSLIDNQDIYVRQENSSLIKQSSTLEEHYSFDVDEDSGNDHSSCEERADEVEQAKVEDEQCSSVEDQFSFEEKQSCSEEEQDSVELEESYAEYQESHGKGSPMEEDTKCETVVEQPRCRSVEQMKQSVAERISLLQKQVAGAQQRNLIESFETRQLAQNDVPSVLDAEDPTPKRHTSHSLLSTSSVPPSSLSFSYDSGGIITKEPEGYRVRSIKEMFLAKSVVDIQYGQRQFPGQNTSELSDYTPEILDSICPATGSTGYQSQTSSELSSGEDDSGQKSITKGFVRRTIERLNGKKDANFKEPKIQRPPSAPKPKNKGSSIIFSPFHIARSKVVSDLSYFNAANTTERYSEPTRCITFNAQVGPGDIVPIDEGRWLLKENTLIRKSISDPVGINKSLDTSLRHEGMFEDTREDVPYSLFSTKSEHREDKVKAAKCIYFSLPHAKSESDLCQDDVSTVSKNSFEEPIVERNEESEETKTWAERNGTLPSIIPTDFKMLDNKVHPLVEGALGESQVVVLQPRKGHGVVSRGHQEPDALDMLYTFCGQHCPIL